MTPQFITFHWSAGGYTQVFDDYHFCVLGPPQDGVVKQTRSVYTPGAHTWRRNTNNVGVAVMAMAKDCPVTALQMERAARCAAELCYRFNIPLERVRDHAHYAKLDKYYPFRCDVGSLCEVLRGKTQWYLQRIHGASDYQIIHRLY